jgi:hypothetical protein
MIGAELRLKTVHRMAEWRSHYSRIGYDHVEGLALRHQTVGAGSDTLQVRKIERNQLEAATIRRGVFSHVRGCGFGFHQVPGRSDHVCALGGKSPRCLNSDARGHSGNEDPFAVQIDPFENIVCR